MNIVFNKKPDVAREIPYGSTDKYLISKKDEKDGKILYLYNLSSGSYTPNIKEAVRLDLKNIPIKYADESVYTIIKEIVTLSKTSIKITVA